MTAMHIDSAPLLARGRASGPDESAESLSSRWAVLNEAADAAATLAGIGRAPLPPYLADLPRILCDAGGWRRERAEQAIDDLCAIMQPGLSALLAIHERGDDARAPALALWQEFERARNALLELLAPPQE